MINRIVLFVILTMTCISLSGCFQMMGEQAHEKAIEKFPTYAEVKMEWGTVPEGYGRVVLFVGKIGLNPFAPVSGSGYASFLFEVDDLPKIRMMDQTFVFIDLPAGKHFFNCYPSGSLYRGKPIEFNILTGEIMYINSGLNMVTNHEAENQLKQVHHNFEKALPFDKQSKSAQSVLSGKKHIASTAPEELVNLPVALAVNNQQFEGSVSVRTDIPLFDNGQYNVCVQNWVDNANLKTAIEKAIVQSGLFVRIEQNSADYNLDVSVEKIESSLEIFGKGFVIQMKSIWRLKRKDGAMLACDFINGQGASHAAGRSAHKQSLILATRETIQNGLLMLSRQSNVLSTTVVR